MGQPGYFASETRGSLWNPKDDARDWVEIDSVRAGVFGARALVSYVHHPLRPLHPLHT